MSKQTSFENFCLKKSKFFVNLPEKIEIFRQFPWRNRNFSSICLQKSKFFSGKIEIFRKFPWKNQIFFYPDPRPPRFQTRLTPLQLWARFLVMTVDKFIYRNCDLVRSQPRPKN